MKTIHKFDISGIDCKIRMPKKAKILTIQNQKENYSLWAEVDTQEPDEWVLFEIFVTGQEIKDDGVNREYISTIQSSGGNFVVHIYRIIF